MKRWLVLVAMLALATLARAQPSGILLVAKPDLVDPNFRETVLVVTRAPDGSTVGVVLNRPTEKRFGKFPDPLYAGGPVMQEVVVALFAADKAHLGDVFYDGVASRADPLIDQWKRETAGEEES